VKTFNGGKHAWEVSVNVGTIKRVKSLLKLDLMEVFADGGKLLDRLLTDPVLLCDVVFVMCKPQADSLGVSDEAFASAMGGDALAAATQALLEELADFFRGKTGQDVFGQIVKKLRTTQSYAAKLVMDRLEAPETDARMQAAVNRMFATSQTDAGTPSGSAPEFSASPPTLSPSPT